MGDYEGGRLEGPPVAEPDKLDEQGERLIEEATNALYRRAVAMHESLIAGRGAVDWDDPQAQAVLRALLLADRERRPEGEAARLDAQIKADLLAQIEELREAAREAKRLLDEGTPPSGGTHSQAARANVAAWKVLHDALGDSTRRGR